MSNQTVLREGYLTLKEAARERGVSFSALKMFVWTHNVPTHRVGNVVVVKSTDLVSYVPRGQRLVGSTL